MTSDPFSNFDWSAHNAWMIEYGKRFAKGIAEDIEPLPPLEWWKEPRWEVEQGSGYAPDGDYRRPMT